MVNEVSGLKPLFESKLTSVEDALRELEALPDVVPVPEIEKKTSEDNVVPVGNIENDFYVFEKEELLKVTTPEYRNFLKENDYADIDNCSRLEISKGLLYVDEKVASYCRVNDIFLHKNAYYININHSDARKLSDKLGYKILTTQLMYNLFIPYIKKEAENNHEVKKTLDEMRLYSEWLEDRVDMAHILKIGNNNMGIIMPLSINHGKFNRSDLNEYGYPNTLRIDGEFSYSYDNLDSRAVLRYPKSNIIFDQFCLGLDKSPDSKYDKIGLRLARFVKIKS